MLTGILDALLSALPHYPSSVETGHGQSSQILSNAASMVDVATIKASADWWGDDFDAAARTITSWSQSADDLAIYHNRVGAIAQSASAAISNHGSVLTTLREDLGRLETLAGPALMFPFGQLAMLTEAIGTSQAAVTQMSALNGELAGLADDLILLSQSLPDVPVFDDEFEPEALDAVLTASHADADNDKGTPGCAITLPSGEMVYAPNERAAKAVRAALSQLGVPYGYGSYSPGQRLDCSALTQWSYKQAGIDIPRVAENQTIGEQITAAQVQPGDLAVWSGHVAMAVGNNKLIEAGDPVAISPIRTDNIGMDFYGFYRPTASA